MESAGDGMEHTSFPVDVPGAAEIVNWFGHWPTFHDAEILSIELNRSGTSTLKVHTFATSKELDARGYFITNKHAVVSFLLDGICALQLDGFNHQNVIFDLGINKHDDGYELVLGGCNGVEGRLVAREIQIAFEAGVPPSSVYA
jgi:hypothetical protein